MSNFSLQNLFNQQANKTINNLLKLSVEQQSASVGYYIVNSSGIIVDVNDTVIGMLGYQREELIDQPFFKFITPEKRAEVQKFFKLKFTGIFIPQINELTYQKKNGSVVLISFNDLLLLDENKNVIGIKTKIIDISKEKLLNQDLKDGFLFLQSIIDAVSNPIFFKNTNFVYLGCNQAFADFFGLTKQDVVGKNDFDLYPKDIALLHQKSDISIIQNKGKETYELKIQNANKNSRDIVFEKGYFEQPPGLSVGIAGTMFDISYYKQDEEIISVKEKKFRKFFESTNEGVVIINEQGYIKMINNNFLFLTGYEEIELIDSHISKIIHPDDYNKIANFFKKSFAIEKVSFASNSRIINKDQNILYISYNATPIITNNESISLQIVARDITQQKQYEDEIKKLNEFNQRILDNAPVSIMVLDKKGEVIAYNKKAFDLMKMTKKDLLDLILPEEENIKKVPELLINYRRLLNEGRSFYYYNLPYKLKQNQEQKYLNIIAVPLYNNGQVDGAISMGLDNTEAVIAKQKLEYLNRELEEKVTQRTHELFDINQELNKVLDLKSKFIADTSHELRTPLTIIQGNIDLAINQYKKTNKKIPEIYDIIDKEAERMTTLITDLSLLSNIDANKEIMNYEKININLLIKVIGRAVNILAKQRNIKINYQKSLFDNICVMGDEAKLEKMLLNIVRNAIKYNKENGWIKIWTEQTESGVKIFVSDNGIGIPENEIENIFERFYRVDKSRSRNVGGTGLGLAIVKWIVEAHHGQVSAQSTFGKGSTFSIFLPYDYKNQMNKNSLF
jgi:PAS domain S-box-containing protein